MKLFFKALVRYLSSLIVIAAMLFLPAGSIKFWNGWLFIAALFLPMLFAWIYLTIKDPELLEKRFKTKEKEKTQKAYVILSIVAFALTFLIPGFDFRYGWSAVPFWLVVLSTVIMFAGYIMFFVVMKQNSYASRVIEIQQGQRVIDTGLYGVVRHPMYTAALIIYGFSPLILGSYYALIPMLFIPALLVMRILNEEKVLTNELPGYPEYMKKVSFRLIPFIW